MNCGGKWNGSRGGEGRVLKVNVTQVNQACQILGQAR